MGGGFAPTMCKLALRIATLRRHETKTYQDLQHAYDAKMYTKITQRQVSPPTLFCVFVLGHLKSTSFQHFTLSW
jgi:hypothetical protein